MNSSSAAVFALALILCANIQHVSSFQMPGQASRILGVPSATSLQPHTSIDRTSYRSHNGKHVMGNIAAMQMMMRVASVADTSSTCLFASPADANTEDDGNDARASPSEKSNKSVTAEGDSDTSGGMGDLLNFSGLGEFDPNKKIPLKREVLVGNPQLRVKKKEKSVTSILQELAAIQKQGPRKYCILGTRHCSYLHQQIIELLSYALVLSENHVYTSGAGGTNAAAIRGALRAERPDLLTVILPQSLGKQDRESQELIRDVTDVKTMPQNDDMSLNVASRLCNSKLLSETDQLIAFAFHESATVIEATKEAKKLEMLVTMLFLD
jgi:hypothetical protein